MARYRSVYEIRKIYVIARSRWSMLEWMSALPFRLREGIDVVYVDNLSDIRRKENGVYIKLPGWIQRNDAAALDYRIKFIYKMNEITTKDMMDIHQRNNITYVYDFLYDFKRWFHSWRSVHYYHMKVMFERRSKQKTVISLFGRTIWGQKKANEVMENS